MNETQGFSLALPYKGPAIIPMQSRINVFFTIFSILLHGMS